MENNAKTREPLDDDALGEVTGGSAEHIFEEEPASSYKEASEVMTP